MQTATKPVTRRAKNFTNSRKRTVTTPRTFTEQGQRVARRRTLLILAEGDA